MVPSGVRPGLQQPRTAPGFVWETWGESLDSYSPRLRGTSTWTATMKTQYQLVERGDYWLVPLQGKTVTRCLVDHAFGLELWECESTTTIRLEGDFVLQEPSGEYQLSPAHLTALGPALSALGKTVAAAKVYKDGCLEVHFADASTLSVKPDAEYEAWEIAGTGGLRVVCTPGGSLAIWQPARDDNGR